jgi:hypothetical protein
MLRTLHAKKEGRLNNLSRNADGAQGVNLDFRRGCDAGVKAQLPFHLREIRRKSISEPLVDVISGPRCDLLPIAQGRE